MQHTYSDSPRGRRELTFVVSFIVLSWVVPLVCLELYPFSIVPLFSDAPQVMCHYRVFDPQGAPVNPSAVGLHRYYWGIPLEFPHAMAAPPTVDRPGVVPTEAEARPYVKPGLARVGLAFVTIEQVVIGAGPGGRLAALQTNTWRIER